MKKLVLILITSLMLSGCFWNKKPVVELECEKEPLALEQIQPLELRSVQFTIITEENWREIFDSLKEKGIDPVLFGLTDNQYENLSINISETIILIKKQDDQIEAYRTYYETETDLESEE